jgi:hypothetical protein
VKIKSNIQKSIFQVRYKPSLSFYDRLFSKEAIFKHFPHWQTDRLKITLRDFDKKHSLTMSYESTTYETDKHLKKNEEEIVSLLYDNLEEITSFDNINRLGYRVLSLAPVKISFNELVTILNIKLFKKDLFKALNQDPDDSTITITSIFKDIKYRLTIGPMKNTEVPNYINFNIENHVDPSSQKKYSEISELIENYPETSLYIDVDLFKLQPLTATDIKDFYINASKAYSYLTDELLRYIFEDKL